MSFDYSFGHSFGRSFGRSFGHSFGHSFDMSVIHMNLNAILSFKDSMSHEDMFPSLTKAYRDSFIKHATALYQEYPEQFISFWKDKYMYDLACICNVNTAIDNIISYYAQHK